MKVKVNVAQLCPTLCNPMDYAVHGILQARILESLGPAQQQTNLRERCRRRIKKNKTQK